MQVSEPPRRVVGYGVLAALTAIALAPPALLAGTLVGEQAIAVGGAIAAVLITALALLAARRGQHDHRLAVLCAGAAPALGVAALGFLQRALVAGPAHLEPARPSPLLVVLLGTGAAIAVAWLVVRAHEAPLVRAVARWSSACVTVLAFLAAVVATLGARAPTPHAALASRPPDARLPPMPASSEREQRAVHGTLELRRRCDTWCTIAVAMDRGNRFELVSTHAVSDRIGSSALSILDVGGTLVVAPSEGVQLRLRDAIAIDPVSGRLTSLSPRALGEQLAAPPMWRQGATLGLLLALVCLGVALRARATRSRVSRGLDGEIDTEGVVRVGGAIARSVAGVSPGPVVVWQLASSPASYRGSALGAARVITGTRAGWMRVLDERALACELAAVAAIAITHAPLIAAWALGAR